MSHTRFFLIAFSLLFVHHQDARRRVVSFYAAPDPAGSANLYLVLWTVVMWRMILFAIKYDYYWRIPHNRVGKFSGNSAILNRTIFIFYWKSDFILIIPFLFYRCGWCATLPRQHYKQGSLPATPIWWRIPPRRSKVLNYKSSWSKLKYYDMITEFWRKEFVGSFLVRTASMKVTDHIGIGADGGSAFVCIMGQGSYAVYIYGDPS